MSDINPAEIRATCEKVRSLYREAEVGKDTYLGNVVTACEQLLADRERPDRQSWMSLSGERDGWESRAEKAEKFKRWVHAYLDSKLVPHHPPGIHGAEGCRIGDRMDWVFDDRESICKRAEKAEAALASLLEMSVSCITDVEIKENKRRREAARECVENALNAHYG